jgi:predicted DNA-binding WGR domain protein
MPTVSYKCGHTGKVKTKTFPYNAVGKAQATEFAKTMKGSVKNNPGYGMEKKMTSSY